MAEYFGTWCEHKPFASPEEAMERLAAVKSAAEDSRAWLWINGITPTTTSKIEVVKVEGGYMVKKTITDL